MPRRCLQCGAPIPEPTEPARPKLPPVKLTPIEREVFLGIQAGESQAEIGARLGLTRRGVESAVERVMVRLGARTQAQALAMLKDAGAL